MTENQWRAWLKIKSEAFTARLVRTKSGTPDGPYYRSMDFLLADLEGILREAKARRSTVKTLRTRGK